MYIVPIAWLYVAFMMSAAEATNTNGSVLGAVITFVLYGVMPVSILMYIMGTPGRKRLLREKEAAERAASQGPINPTDNAIASVAPPDASRHAPADAVAPVGEKH